MAWVLLFSTPGLAFLVTRRSAGEKQRLPLDEGLFLTVAVSVAASSWVALLLAEGGRFSLAAVAGVVTAVSAIVLVARRHDLAWPYHRPRHLSDAAPILLVAGLALNLQIRPGEHVVGGRDQGVYVATMALMARTGGLAPVDPVVRAIPAVDRGLFWDDAERVPFSGSRFTGFPLESPESGRVFPQFFHLFPAFGALLHAGAGTSGALAAAGLLGVLGTLAVFFALRLWVGAGAALLAALLLETNLVQVWFARSSLSETFQQLLVFLGVLALARWERRGGAAFGALAGTAFGLALLARIDSLLVVTALVLYLAWRLARREIPPRAVLPVVVPLAVLALHAGVHAWLFSPRYALDVARRPYWVPGIGTVVASLVLGAVMVPRLLKSDAPRRAAWRGAGAGALIALALYAYFVRPRLSAWAGGDGNTEPLWGAVAFGLHDLGYDHLAAHDAQAFVRLGWFAGPLALALGVLGTAALVRRGRARDRFPILLGLTFAVFYLYKTRVSDDYPFAMRRFAAVTLPCLLAAAAWLLVTLARRPDARRALAVAGMVALAAPVATRTWAVNEHVEWEGSVDLVQDLARRPQRGDVVLAEGSPTVELFALPLWAVHGVNVIPLAHRDPDPERLAHLLRTWRSRYRHVYVLHTAQMDPCVAFLAPVRSYMVHTAALERAHAAMPEQTRRLDTRLTLSEARLPEELETAPLSWVDVGARDDRQVSGGFFEREHTGERDYRWLGRCGLVSLPAPPPGARSLVIAAAAGPRPGGGPVAVDASLSGRPVGALAVRPEWAEYERPLPSDLPAGPLLLRLAAPTWRPSDAFPASDDTRDLGVMVDRIEIRSRDAARP
jgi:hypothetical protein